MEKLLNYNGLEKYNDLIHEDLAKKANIDGYYESLGAGTADQLSSNIVEKDSTPYNFRTAGGSINIGDREVDKIIGGTVAWNQILEYGDFTNATKWVTSNANLVVEGGVGKMTASAQGGFIRRECTAIEGHKYIYSADVKISSGIAMLRAIENKYVESTKVGAFETLSVMVNSTSTATTVYYPRIVDTRASDWDAVEIKNVMVFDLTQMFGSTIADYIYSLEQATTGAGVAFFRKLFPKPYYAYNAGELMSVQASSHDMVGFNAWDEQWEAGSLDNNGVPMSDSTSIRSKNFIHVMPNTSYYIKTSGTCYMRYFDADKNIIGKVDKNGSGNVNDNNRIRVMHDNCYFVKFYVNETTYNNDICINLSWDGERDGEYEEYVKHSYALDSSLTLRGIFKLDADNNLYADGDEYESDGNVERRYGIVDLGTLNWYISSGVFVNGTDPTDLHTKERGGELITPQYTRSGSASAANMADRSVQMMGGVGNANFYIKDSRYSMASDFKNAMSGVYLVYELATTTEETADPYTNPQIVDDFGTEEYVDYAYANGDRDVAIPVGHYTEYMANLKAKLEMAPNSPEGEGDYIVRQTNGTNEYVPLASNATIQNIIARLEALEGDTEGGGE